MCDLEVTILAIEQLHISIILLHIWQRDVLDTALTFEENELLCRCLVRVTGTTGSTLCGIIKLLLHLIIINNVKE